MKTKKGKLTLDVLDLKILAALQTDGRLTKAALADKIGLSQSPCWTRVKKLEEAGYIKSYRAEVDLSKLVSLTEIWTQIVLSNHRSADFDKFEQAVTALENVTECWAIGGGADYLVKFVVDGIDAYQHLIDSLLESEIGIDRYYTYIVTKAVKDIASPPLENFVPLPNRDVAT